jgi:hypothetical protein
MPMLCSPSTVSHENMSPQIKHDIGWVFELVECICKGQIFILPALKVLISKPNNNKKSMG